MSVTEVVQPDLAAERALTDTLTKNMREMYQRGIVDGTMTILGQTAGNLDKVSKSPECPDDLKAGFVEAVKYLRSIGSGQPYTLQGKVAVGTPENPKLSKKNTKAAMINKVQDLKKNAPVIRW